MLIQKILSFHIVILVVLFMINTVHAGGLDYQKEALNAIADFADRICSEIQTSGSSENLEISGSAKIELSNLLKKIADLGVEGAAKYQKSEYQGVLQDDLANLIRDTNNCKLEVFKDLKDKLLAQ